MQKFKSVEELVNQLKPEKPVYCIRKNSIKYAVKFFLNKFPGKILYAVKTNPHPEVIKTIIESGVKQFDVASIEEIKNIRTFSNTAKCSFMHTVKSRESIKEAYFNYGVKTFSLDTKDELIKIIESTNNAKDLELFVRVAVSNEHAEIDLSKKFGALTSEAIGLLRLVKQHAKKIGLSFHVGSQCMHPISYSKGINEIGNIIKKTKIIPDYINVGGGFPTIYPDLIPQSLDNYFNEINKSLENLKLEKLPEIICEPGRAIVAESGSTIVRVAVSNEHAEIDLSKKFGALTSEAIGLLRLVKQHAKKVGLSFHVGSQCMHPISYSKGISEIGNIIKKTKIIPDYINVGGGFPTIYPDLIPQSLDNYFNEINKSLENLKLEKLPEIICEPGRAIVAESGSTVVRVNLRKKQKLYINDGTYGTLFDAGTPNIVFPSRMIKENSNKIISKKLTAFDFFGPTCDSMDYMKGPFLLPNNIKENDYVELGQLGAYGLTFRTQFNGYYSNEIYEVEDNPIMTMYDKDINKANMVA